MLRKFAEGLVFGGGFAIAFVLIAMVAMSVMFSAGPPSHMRSSSMTFTTDGGDDADRIEEKPFHELPVEEQIKEASVIALARYESAEDGRMKAVLREFLKKNEGIELYYGVGDEYRPSSYYPKDGTKYGDGLVIFFTGSPAMMRQSMSYSGDRIHSLGDMPLELLRDKCDADVSGGA